MHFAPDYSLLLKVSVGLLFVSCGLYVHYRGQVRHTFKRQVLDHSTLMAPYNVFVYWRSAVPTTPLLDVASVPQLKLLRDHWQVIRDEALALQGEGRIQRADGTNDLAFNSFFRTGWTRFYLKWYGKQLPSAQQHCPRTLELLRQVPQVRAAMFAMLGPDSRLGEHRDPFAGSLRYHLGLVTPNSEDCAIWVDGQRHVWHDGEDVLFDETYVHTARNKTAMHRIVLFCDVERPMKDPVSRLLNRIFARVVVSAAAARNTPDETLGVMNHLFAYVYGIRRAGMWLKERTRRGYYAVKYVLMLLLAYWMFVPAHH